LIPGCKRFFVALGAILASAAPDATAEDTIDEILTRVQENWPEYSLLAVILAKLFQSQLASIIPQTIKDTFKNHAKLKEDQQEHDQAVRMEEMNLTKLKQLSQLSSLSFTEEQLTMMTAETQTQLKDANTFAREIVSTKLDMIIERMAALKEVIHQVKEIQAFILKEIRANNSSGGRDAEKTMATDKTDDY